MKILLTNYTMDVLLGSVLSTYENARVLSRDHDVTVMCGVGGWNGNEVQKKLEALKVKCVYECEKKYDLILASHFCPDVEGFKIQIVRGITPYEKPLPKMDVYSCIRPDVYEHILTEYNVPSERAVIIYNGVDRERFKPAKKSVRAYTKIVAPCDVDSLRYEWLKMMVSITNKERRLYIYTKDTGLKLPKSEWVYYKEPTFYMEHIIADADVVVGIYLGRVNLEARSCGVNSIIYDPYTLEAEPFEIDDVTFDDLHNIENVVKRFLALYENRK